MLRMLAGMRSSTIALLGSATAAFGVFGVLCAFWLISSFRPFGGLDFERVMLLGQAVQGRESAGVAVSNSVEIRERAKSFDTVGWVQFSTVYLRTSDGVEPLSVALVSPEFLALFHARNVMGRGLDRSDEAWSGGPVGLVSESYWRDRMGGPLDVTGRLLPVRDPSFSGVTVVGVLSHDFHGFGFFTGRRVDLVLPQAVRAFERQGRNGMPVTTLARLAPGVSAGSARREVSEIGKQFAHRIGRRAGVNLTLRPASVVFDGVRRRLLLGTVAMAIAFLLVLVCTAGVFQVRAVDRITEISIRLALGARPRYIVGMLIAENLRFFLVTALGGAFLAMTAIELLGPALADGIGLPLAVDAREARWAPFLVLALAPLFALVVAAAQMTMLVPALSGTLATGRSRWTPGRVLLRRGLVAAQSVAAVGLAFLAVGSMEGLRNIERRDLGFRRDHLLSARVTLRQQWPDDPSRWERYFESLVESLKRLPGVQSVGVMQRQVGESRGEGEWRVVEPLAATVPPGPILARGQIVQRGYFREMGLRATAGRLCDEVRAEDGAEIGVINEAMAQRYWPHTDPVGRHFTRGLNDPLKIVGVVPSLRNSLFEDEAIPEVFMCAPYPQMHVMIRYAGEGNGLQAALIPLARQLDREAAVDDILPVEEIVERSLRPSKVLAGFLGSLGGVATLVAALALFSVVAMVVRQRRHELAIRIAVGADPLALGRGVEREGLALGAVGIAGGWALYSGLAKYFGTLGATLYLPWQAACAAALTLLFFMWLAVKWPAYRLRGLDVMAELRQE